MSTKSVTTKFVILSVLFMVSSCSYSIKKNADDQTKSSVTILAKDLSYAKINEQIFKAKCLQCHSGRNQPDLTSYNSILQNKDKIYEQSIGSSKMPKNGRSLTDIERTNLKNWLDAGAPELAVGGDETGSIPVMTPADSAALGFERPVLWSKVKSQIFDQKCVACHFAGNKDGISSYEDYETTKATVGTIFYTVSINPVMPPGPADLAEGQVNPNQLTRAEKDLLSAWITDGMKN